MTTSNNEIYAESAVAAAIKMAGELIAAAKEMQRENLSAQKEMLALVVKGGENLPPEALEALTNAATQVCVGKIESAEKIGLAAAENGTHLIRMMAAVGTAAITQLAPIGAVQAEASRLRAEADLLTAQSASKNGRVEMLSDNIDTLSDRVADIQITVDGLDKFLVKRPTETAQNGKENKVW